MIDVNQLIIFLKMNKGADFLEIAQKFRIDKFNNKLLSNYLFDLCKKNIIEKDRNQNYFPLELVATTESNLIITSKGFGLIIYEDKSFFIHAKYLKNSLNKDLVNANLYKYGMNNFKASINFTISHSIKKVFALITKEENEIKIKVINENIKKEIKISNFNNEYINFFVEAEISKVDEDIVFIEIIKKLKDKNTPYADIELLILSSGVKKEFKSKLDASLQNIPDIVSKLDEGRKDLRDKLIVTIDGNDTKDFDDAILVEEIEEGYKLGVYIADVAYYIKNNDPIDIEARERGTSIYLIDKVIPMLPEKISNGICSLNPNVDRNVIALEVILNRRGIIQSKKIFPALINSKFRLTYNEVNDYENNWIKEKNDLFKMLSNSLHLANIIDENRLKKGYVNLEIDEPKIILDDKGVTQDIKIRERGLSEKMIEVFMVLANEEVAKTIYNLKLPSLYRVHAYPSEEKINSLQNILSFLNINVQLPKEENWSKLFEKINDIFKIKNDDLMKINILRTMSKAKYSTTNIGHFGLGLDYYTHFTSPIRRYPDLIIHRILRELVINKNNSFLLEIKKTIEYIANHSSTTEETAIILERNVTGMKLSQYYQNKIEEIFEGTIVTIKKFGIFVELKNKATVLVAIENIKNGPFSITENETKLFNDNKEYKLGENVLVKIIGVDYLNQKIDGVFKN
ncbi:MAG: ribonuclease R family protein [Metamycoplasmataceae bacterium]